MVRADIKKLRDTCTGFNQWLTQLEQLAVKAS